MRRPRARAERMPSHRALRDALVDPRWRPMRRRACAAGGSNGARRCAPEPEDARALERRWGGDPERAAACRGRERPDLAACRKSKLAATTATTTTTGSSTPGGWEWSEGDLVVRGRVGTRIDGGTGAAAGRRRGERTSRGSEGGARKGAPDPPRRRTRVGLGSSVAVRSPSKLEKEKEEDDDDDEEEEEEEGGVAATTDDDDEETITSLRRTPVLRAGDATRSR